ncbi:HAD family hydrolase [Thermodesulfobacteriota bacterium]
MTYSAVLFDLDGTLLDTLDDIADASNRVLASQGFPVHGRDRYQAFIGDGAATLVTRALPDVYRDERTIATCLKAFREEYGQAWDVKTRVFPGVCEMLDALEQRRIRLAILSNKPHEFTLKCAERYLSEWPFRVVLGQREGVPRKPDPTGGLEAAVWLGISPGCCVYVGDSAVDMRTALAAGMFPVAVLWGYRTAQELSGAGARVLIENPLQLLDVLDRVDGPGCQEQGSRA